jgi:hypothetical protein
MIDDPIIIPLRGVRLLRDQAWPIVQHMFPMYKGHKFILSFKEKVVLTDMIAGGVVTNLYSSMTIEDGVIKSMTAKRLAPVSDGTMMELTYSMIMARHSFFGTKDMGITIYAHPSTAVRWIGW